MVRLSVSTYCSAHCSSGAARMQSSNLCFIAKIVQCEDFLLILHKDNLQRAMNNNAVIIPQTKKKKITNLASARMTGSDLCKQ